MVRDPQTLGVALQRVTPELFNPQLEALEAAIWRATSTTYQETGQLMNREVFLCAVEKMLREYHPDYPVREDELERTANIIFRFESTALNYQLIAPLLQAFLLERKTEPLVSQLSGVGTSLNLDLIADLQRAASESRLSGVQITDMADLKDDEFAVVKREMTGFRPLDVLIGGYRPGEVIGLLGPMKGGKTSFCHTLITEFIQQKDKNHKVTYLSYEEPASVQKLKILIAYMNRFHRDQLEGQLISQMPSEVQLALAAAAPVIGRSVQLIDMSGAVPGQGFGGAVELETFIGDLARRNALGQLVIIDHALPLVTNYMAVARLDPAKAMRHQVDGLCNKVRALAAQYNICILLCHQMDATGNKKSPLHKPSHMDAAECKMFSQYLHHVLCLGVKDPQSNVSWLNLSASRSRPNAACHIRIVGEFCRVQHEDSFLADQRAGGFVSVHNGMLRAGNEETGRTTPLPAMGRECGNI